jgi:hypothetical protein
MIQHITRLCVAVILCNSLAFAQGTKVTGTANGRRGEAEKIRTRDQEEADDLRQEKIKALRVYTLSRLVDAIKKIDDPALRISARSEFLKYLSQDGVVSESEANAGNMAQDSLADFLEHGNEILPSLGEYLFSNLEVWIRKYQPSLKEKMESVKKTRLTGKSSQEIRALMDSPGGDVLAARRITQSLEDGQDMPVLILYLNELIRSNSSEVEPLLTTLVDVAAQGRLSFETLLSISDLYLQPRRPLALRRRFLAMVVARTQPFNFANGAPPQSAYDLLTSVLPAIQQLMPESFDQAVNQRQVIYASFDKAQVAGDERNKRLNESPSGIEDLVAEAEEAKSKSHRNELLSEAAQLALERKKFALCLEVLAKLDLDAVGISPDFWSNWNDQFLREFVKAVLAVGKPETAERATEHARASNVKVELLILMAQYAAKANDKASSERLLIEGSNAAGAAADHIERARAFLLLSGASEPNGSLKGERLESAVKALNSVSMPDRGDDVKPYQRYVWKLNGAEYQVSKGFKDFSAKNIEEASVLAEKLIKPESRAFALLGVLQGARWLSLSRKT